ncbi:hypothetical protein LSH36_232g04066 [Paralvinella palmiformis]|uniref:DNA replication complex GINS protein PSF3 n=1 Tax=Paralvinella palmiformis TaxID=53620 RepID=A0AAD9JN33_9ANNE|nr:hypothetical protein LSH36_232g04066 [Paralvinella palmiformis]
MSSSHDSRGSQNFEATGDYFSLDDILATQERIPCTFQTEVLNLGYIDPSLDSSNIPKGTKLELPFWLAKALCSRRKQCVTIDLPKHYKEVYRDVFNADANVVDLHKLGPYFYRFGSHLLHFEHPESPDIAKSLLKVFQARFRDIMDASQNAYDQDMSKMTEKLDEMEKVIFFHGQKGLKDLQMWETREGEKIKISEMVINHRKRKRTHLDES